MHTEKQKKQGKAREHNITNGKEKTNMTKAIKSSLISHLIILLLLSLHIPWQCSAWTVYCLDTLTPGCFLFCQGTWIIIKCQLANQRDLFSLSFGFPTPQTLQVLRSSTENNSFTRRILKFSRDTLLALKREMCDGLRRAFVPSLVSGIPSFTGDDVTVTVGLADCSCTWVALGVLDCGLGVLDWNRVGLKVLEWLWLDVGVWSDVTSKFKAFSICTMDSCSSILSACT